MASIYIQPFTSSVSNVGTTTPSRATGTTTATFVQHGLSVLSATANTAKIYVGVASTITSGTTDATNGYELAPGVSVLVPASAMVNGDASNVYVCAAAATQKVYIFGY